MNEITNSNSTCITRNADLIAAEINNIKDQTKKMVVYNSIEIGRRLVEAKEIVEHGGWCNWLEKSVDYSQRTATNLMRIFEEYGADQITLLNDNSKSQALAGLSYTQAVALLGIPSEERETFVKDNNVEEMSTRELQKTIKERDEALKTLETAKIIANEKSEEALKNFNEKCKAESELRTTDKCLRDTQNDVKNLQSALSKEKDNLKKEKENSIKEIANLQSFIGEAKVAGNDEEVVRLQASLKEIQDDLDTSALKIDELEAQLKEKPIDVITAEPVVIEKVPEEVAKELAELRAKSANTPITEFKVYFKYLNEAFDKELKIMGDIKLSDPEIYQKCKSNILRLINSMAEKL